MATTTVTYAPATGRDFVTLTSWAGNAGFATTPVAGDQVEGDATLTLNPDGTASGPDGSYELRHIVQSTGSTEAAAYDIDESAPTLSSLSASKSANDAIAVSVDTDESGGTVYFYASGNASENAATVKASAQSSETVSALGEQSSEISGLAVGDYYVHAMHEDANSNQSAVLSSAQVALEEVATATVSYSSGSSRTTVTLGADIEPYLFQDWAAQPETGEQLTTQTSAGTFDTEGNFSTDVEAVIPVHHTALDGTVTRFTIDTTGLDGAIDTTPADFSFTALTNQARSVPVTSNAMIVQDVDASADIPVTVENGEYSVSTDGGATYGGWTTAQTNVRLNYRVRVRHTTSDEYSSGGYDGVRETTLTVGGVSRVFRSTTLADTTPPVITLTGGNQSIVQGQPWVEPGYEAIDNADGDISVSGVVVTGTVDTSTLGQYTLTYTATDLSGNTSSTTRTVTVVEFVPDDTTAPVITLTGGNRTLTVGDTWVDPGYTANDETDGDLTDDVEISGTVDTTRAGSYQVVYTVADATGNVGTATRTVTVLPATQYPLTETAPANRTFEGKRVLRFESGEPIFILQSGETLDFDFDLTNWLTDQGDDIAEGTHQIEELAEALEVMASGTIPGTDRIKVWLRAGEVKDSQTSLVQLTVTTTGLRTAVFQFRALIINRMQ
ncbi:immunoglobulin-like domain-containing protein [Marinobacter salarius]|uniref:immunoglobulin-like domain-containing protein n=1 Tax=Marinobacter salarius TaxID=1420917 RepID=UPI003D0BAAE3